MKSHELFAQAGLKLALLVTSQVAGITSMSHHAQLQLMFIDQMSE
jgi:hypothetical protein